MALDLHQKECPKCGDYIPFTRKFLIFRPLPRDLKCPTCGHMCPTSFFQRGIAFFFWTMRTYMLLGMIFFLVVTYVQAGLWVQHGPAQLIPYCIKNGPSVFFLFSFICLFTSFTIQAVVDYIFRHRETK